MAQEFEVIPLQGGLDTSSLDKNIKIRKSSLIREYSYLRPEKRDEILSRYLPDEIKKMDASERDLLYKSIIHYDEPTLTIKYPFLKKIILKELKDELL
jgi:hypothetical protein